jgi:uncharacterized membrane protein YfcA
VGALAACAGYLAAGLHEQLLPPGVAGYLDPLRALPLIAGSIPMAVVGASLSERSSLPVLQKILGICLVALALKMLVAP